MSAIKAKRLRDILVRQQLFVEQIRAGQNAQYATFARIWQAEIKELLVNIPYKTMDGMTKTELKNFVSQMRKNQLRLWNQHVAIVIADMEDFTNQSKRMAKRIYASYAIQFNTATNKVVIPDDEYADSVLSEVEAEEDNTTLFGWLSLRKSEAGDARMWASVYHAIIPANGMTIAEMIEGLSIQSQYAIESIIKQAYANSWTVAETIDRIIGTKEARYQDGAMHTRRNASAAVMATVVQQVAMQTTAAVQSAYFDRYIWISIMDTRTTHTCRKLNGTVYEYGNGPLPPAHIRCRSHIEPFVGDDSFNETLYNWAKRQPEKVLAMVFSTSIAAKIISGKAVADEIEGFTAETELPVNDYEFVIETILSQ